MTEKANKKHGKVLLLTILMAVALIVSGFGIIGADYMTASAGSTSNVTETDSATDTTSESYDGSEVTYESASVVVNTSTPGYYSYAAKPGEYKLEVWGAQGGGNSTSSWGGYGGYTYATFRVTAATTLYYAVGGGGTRYSGANTAATNGEINGGGGLNRGHNGGTGGGASHVATRQGTASGALSGLASYKDDVLVVAGGGGGVGCSCATNATNYAGYGGGGLNNGQSAPATLHSTNRGGGYGGTVTSTGGGAGGAGGKGNGNTYSAGVAGSFGQGGRQDSNTSGSYPSCGGGGGGGGWYGGGSGGSDIGCNDYDDGSGGGGSGYINTSRVLANTYGGTSNSNGAHQQKGVNGRVQITLLNAAPTQSDVPEFTVNRSSYSTFNLIGTNKTSTLLGSDLDTATLGDVVKVYTAGIYTTAATSSPANSNANYWLDWQNTNKDSTSISIKAKRWWSGTLTFYVEVYDVHTSSNTSASTPVWFSFKASCTAGTVSAASGPKNLGLNGTNDNSKYNYGNTNITNVPSQAQAASVTNGKIYNPTGSGRRTLWLKDALSSNNTTKIKIEDLFTSNRSTEEKMSFSTSVTYGATRYTNNVYDANPSTAQAISSAVAGSNSSFFTDVTFSDDVKVSYFNGNGVTANYTRGYGTLNLKAKPNIPAGAYYYVITVTAQQVCNMGGTIISTQQIDIVYRVDNTRPKFPGESGSTVSKEPFIKVKSGNSEPISIADICNDVDGNSLTISDVIVPDNEFVLTDQYGNGRKLPADTNYNYGVNNSAGMSSATQAFDSSKTSAQLPDSASTRTGFSRSSIYKTTGSDADDSFMSTQNVDHGTADTAFIGYYVNSSRNTLTIVGNKASRYQYAQSRTRTGHFYILVRITDSGDNTDMGIWYPIAVEVISSTPIAAGSPSVSGARGDVFYLSPLSVYDPVTNAYIAVGAPNDRGGSLLDDAVADNGNADADNTRRNVIPFAYDVDNIVSKDTESRTVQGYTATILETHKATWAHSDTVFLTKGSTKNAAVTTGLYAAGSPYANDPHYNNINSVDYGFKEFYAVEEVYLYASPSVLLGLTDSEIDALVSNGVIYVGGVGGNNATAYVRFTGLKVTLKKYTSEKYISFEVDVTNVFTQTDAAYPQTGRVRIAVNVENNNFSSANTADANDNARISSGTGVNFNLRPDADHPYGTAVRNTTVSSARPVFEFTARVGDKIAISPYDLFWDYDIYDVNSVNGPAAVTAFDTTPDGSTAHANMLKGVNKSIAVLASDSPSGAVTEYPTASGEKFGYKRLYIAASNQNLTGQISNVYYGSVKYVEETSTVAEHFLVTAERKTPANGYISFNYVVTSTAGDVAIAEIRIFVENSLPTPRTDLVPVFYLSATPNYIVRDAEDKIIPAQSIQSNSSIDEDFAVVNGETQSYYSINEYTYNVREFLLSDLFVDADNDLVLFADAITGIRVGTKDTLGNFVRFTSEQNVYVRASIGAGSNNRNGKNNCLIIEGLSSTQGLPGGLWINFDVTDNAVGTNGRYKTYSFQVEVMNSDPEYAEFTDTNAMESTGTNSYAWRVEQEETAPTLNNLRAPNAAADAQALTSVLKPMYVVSNMNAMETYKNLVCANGSPNNFVYQHGTLSTFAYSSSQVRVIAQDKDKGQGLALATVYYDTTTDGYRVPGFSVGNTMSENSAVRINDFYSVNNDSYYTTNNIVRIAFFKRVPSESGAYTDAYGARYNLVWTEDEKETNEAIDWVVAIAPTTKPNTQMHVELRLRDSNGVAPMPSATAEGATVAQATAGGNTLGKAVAYKGARRVENGVFVADTDKGGARVSVSQKKVFGFDVILRSGGIYDNFSKWKNSAVENVTVTVDGQEHTFQANMNNVWYCVDADGNNVYYHNTIGKNSISSSADIFRYSGITVRDTAGVNVPLSYFAWPSGNTDSKRGGAQETFAFFNTSSGKGQSETNAPFYYSNTNVGKIGEEEYTVTNTATDLLVYNAITLSDGFNSWTGETLNNNPYVTIGYLTPQADNNKIASFSNSEYLTKQQRFKLNTTDNIGYDDTHHANATEKQYFFEDTVGLSFVKKGVRSVGSLTLTIRMATWEYKNIAPDGSDAFYRYRIDKGEQRDEDKTAEIVVPLTIENSKLSLDAPDSEREILLTSASTAGHVIGLSHKNGTVFAASQTVITDTEESQYGANRSDHYAQGTYDEEMYFLANSIEANFTQAQLTYIKNQLSSLSAIDGTMPQRVNKYFGVNAALQKQAAINAIFNTGDTVTLRDKANEWEKTNYKYDNYFTISPTAVDSKYITLTPKNLTVFRPDYSTIHTKGELDTAAAQRGLRVRYVNDALNLDPLTLTDEQKTALDNTEITESSVSYMYVQLKLIVYDRLYVGITSNTTTFTESSFDVLTFRIRIVNSNPQPNATSFGSNLSTTGYKGRILELSKGGISATFRFSDMISDADMITDASGHFLGEDEISSRLTTDKNAADNDQTGNLIYRADAEVKKQTADYLNTKHPVGSSDNVQYVANNKGLFHLTYFTGGANGALVPISGPAEENDAVKAIPVTVNGQDITISVANRLQGVSPSDVALYCMFTFTDSYGKDCSVVLGIRIANAKPTLTNEAQSTTSITMKTGQYFTMYTTPYKNFMEGWGISDTVGDSGTEENKSYAGGTYNSASSKSSLINASYYQQWSYTGLDNGSQRIALPSAVINGVAPEGTPLNYVDGREKPAHKNIGFMAIATDDAPWTLRFDPNAGDVGRNPGVRIDVGSDVISATGLNDTLFEGATVGGAHGYTAYQFEALAACSNVLVTITLTDGISSIDGANARSLVYTFRITVESTDPTALTNKADNRFGASLTTQGFRDRFEYSTTSESYVYTLKMHVGESVSFLTKDFANDVDAGDNDKMYLLPMEAGNLFRISDMDNGAGVAADTSRFLSIEHNSANPGLTAQHTRFTITALNFHNDTAKESDFYSTVRFYICDPYASTTAHALSIQLQVYIYPHEVKTASGTVKETTVVSLADYDKLGKQATEVKLVSMPGEGGLIEDKDADASLTSYSVKVYSLAYYANTENKTGILAYSANDFATVENKAPFLVAFTDTLTAGVHADIVKTFISSFEFSEDGKTMYMTPAKATNGENHIAGYNAREGFQLYIEVTKNISREHGISGDYGPIYGHTRIADTAAAALTTRVDNSAPTVVSDTDNNFNVRDNYLPYLTIEGAKGDGEIEVVNEDTTIKHEGWDFYMYNPYSDEALFVDRDGDKISVDTSNYAVTSVYTLDDNDLPVYHTANYRDTAKAAFTVSAIEKEYKIPNSTEVVTLPAIKITIVNKIDIINYRDRMVYVTIEFTGKDSSGKTSATSSEKAVITLGIGNSVPEFKATEDIAAIYNSEDYQTSYSRDDRGNAQLTLTLSRDDNDKLITKSNGGVVRIPLTDLVKDNDYNSNIRLNKERFSFVSPASTIGKVDLHEISGHAAYTFWIEKGEHGVATTRAESDEIANKRFLIAVSDDTNTSLVIKVNSYDRGTSDSVVLVVSDSSGATTGELTITLVVGNSAPVDLTGTGEASGTIILAGGSETTYTGSADDEEAEELMKRLDPVKFSIFDFVRDNNTHDMDPMDGEPAEARTYLRIVDFTPGTPYFDKSSNFKPHERDYTLAGLDQPAYLVAMVPSDQSFTVAPLVELYGRQTFELAISDTGNSSALGSVTIWIRIEIQVTKNPDEMPTFNFDVYWKRTMPITARDILDDKDTEDVNEGEGLIITNITILDNPTDKIAEEVNVAGSNEWYIRGLINGKSVNAEAEVVVGNRVTDSLKRYTKKFTINVVDNKKPIFRHNDNGVPYGDDITYIPKGYLDENGRWEVSIDTFFEDKEGDDIALLSASSNKSVLIDVTPNTQTDTLVFHFKNRGDAIIRVRIQDAVTAYSYTFKLGNNDLAAPNFFVGIISHMQSNPTIYIIIGCALLLFILLLIIIIAAARKKRKMRKEIEALLVSEMELEEQMLKLAAGPSQTYFQQSYGYLPPTQGAPTQNPGFMLGTGQAAPNPNAAIGLNPGNPQAQQGIGSQQLPPPQGGFGDDDL